MKSVTDILAADRLERDDLLALIGARDEEGRRALYRRADDVRRATHGNVVHLRGIIEFSNYCRCDCLYCGVRASNKRVARYRMSEEEILRAAETIAEAGIKTIVLQSGEDLAYTSEAFGEIIREIKRRHDVAITLSLGERPREDYERWREAGADRYLLKHETANRALYERLHPTQSFDERIDALRLLKEIGFQTGSGNVVGFPDQTDEDIADDLLLCRELDVDMASFSPFLPADDTPLADLPSPPLWKTLNVMAAARLVLPDAHIPATTALSAMDPEGRALGLRAGANVVMPTFTPNEFRFNYLIYNAKPGGSEDPTKKLDDLRALLDRLGLRVGDDYGHSVKTKQTAG
ncbi:MAG: [FeFe] hydrogenase H-cluster radical SAM maturase HydE [Ignavibacteriales bacterium]|nr:[FeFe] hydrogenase H-cluster radical SAM maturase HydE [Ignavibacteriales bacterium]